MPANTEQRPTRKLEPWQNQLVRTSIVRAIKAGESDEGVASLKADLRDEFDCTPSQVDSAGAWLAIHASRAGKEHGVPDISREELIYAHEALSTAESNSRYAERLDLLTAHINQRHRTVLEPTQVRELVNLYASKVGLELIGHSDSPTIAVIGSAADYDNPTKVAWRNEWKRFLAERLTTEQVRSGKVLCLPSTEPMRELRVYLELGFKPHQIYGVEGGREQDRAKFRLRAKEIGFHPLTGRLEDILPRRPEAFTVVSLDFLGQVCDAYCEIAMDVRLAPHAFVLVNVREGRERVRHQGALRTLEITSRINDALVPVRRGANGEFPTDNVEAQIDAVEALVAGSKALFTGEGAPALGESRDQNLDYHLLYHLGNRVRPKKDRYVQQFDQLVQIHGSENAAIEGLFGPALFAGKGIGDLLGTLFFRQESTSLPINDTGMVLVKPGSLASLCNRVCFYSPTMVSLERWQYASETSSKGAKYLTSFAEYETPTKMYDSWGATAQFILNVVLAGVQLDDGVKGITFHHRDKRGKAVPVERLAKKTDLILARIGDKTIARGPLGRLMSELGSYELWAEAGEFRGLAGISRVTRQTVQPLE